MTSAEISAALLEFLRDELGVPSDLCGGSAPLFSSGLLDSFALVSLLAFAESRFAVTVPFESLSQELVDTVDGFAGLIAARRDLAAGAAS